MTQEIYPLLHGGKIILLEDMLSEYPKISSIEELLDEYTSQERDENENINKMLFLDENLVYAKVDDPDKFINIINKIYEGSRQDITFKDFCIQWKNIKESKELPEEPKIEEEKKEEVVEEKDSNHKINPSDLEILSEDLVAEKAIISTPLIQTEDNIVPIYAITESDSIVKPSNNFEGYTKKGCGNFDTSPNIQKNTYENKATKTFLKSNNTVTIEKPNQRGLNIVQPINEKKVKINFDEYEFAKSNLYKLKQKKNSSIQQYLSKNKKDENKDYFMSIFKNVSRQTKINVLSDKVYKVTGLTMPENNNDNLNVHTYQDLSRPKITQSTVFNKIFEGNSSIKELIAKEQRDNLLKNNNDFTFSFKTRKYNLKDPKEKELYVETFRKELKQFSLNKDKIRKNRETDNGFNILDLKLQMLRNKTKKKDDELNENNQQFEQNRKHEISENMMKSQDEIENLDNNEKQTQPVIGKLIEEKITAKYEENNKILPE